MLLNKNLNYSILEQAYSLYLSALDCTEFGGSTPKNITNVLRIFTRELRE
jgi:hypothetical protein